MLGILSKKVDVQDQQTSPGLWRLAMRRFKSRSYCYVVVIGVAVLFHHIGTLHDGCDCIKLE